MRYEVIHRRCSVLRRDRLGGLPKPGTWLHRLAVMPLTGLALFGAAQTQAYAGTLQLVPRPGEVVNFRTPTNNILCMAERVQVVDGRRSAEHLTCERFEPELLLATLDSSGAGYKEPNRPFNATGSNVPVLRYGDRWVWGSLETRAARPAGARLGADRRRAWPRIGNGLLCG